VIKVAVYTAIFGGYDPYIEPELDDRCDLFVFTDRPLKTTRAKVIQVTPNPNDLTRSARMYKIMSHAGPVQDYSHVLWIDGSIDLVGVDVPKLAERFLENHDVAAFQHQTIHCVYEGGRAAVLCGKEDPAVMKEHLGKLTGMSYPPNTGLTETGILFRRHNDAVRRFNEAWWLEVQTGSKRDQVSFDYCVDRMGVRLLKIPGKRQDYGLFVREHAR